MLDDELLLELSHVCFEEIDNHLATEVLEKAEKVDDYMYRFDSSTTTDPYLISLRNGELKGLLKKKRYFNRWYLGRVFVSKNTG